MHLCDQIFQARKPAIVLDKAGRPVSFPGPGSFAGRLHDAAHRYVLRHDVSAFCTDLIFNQARFLSSTLDLLKMPASTIWIEWMNHDVGRGEEWLTVGQKNYRAGVLVESEEDGRSGTLKTFWERHGQEPSNSPVTIHFDLDRELTADPARNMLALRHSELDVSTLLSHVVMELDDDWARLLAAKGMLAAERSKVAECNWMTAPLVMAFLALLLFRDSVHRRPADLERLNAIRARRDRPPLLHHEEIFMRLSSVPAGSEGHGSLGHRRAAMMHYVRGHFVRRGSQIFWRRPHLRGEAGLGVVPPRVKVVGL